MRKSLLLLLGIVVLAALLRLFQLGVVPISPDWDEVALGWNAKSIFLTGKDEYGKFLPVVLRSFDDYKPALYTYLAIPPILLFGLETMAVRLPSAVFGVIAVIAVYFLIKELFRSERLSLLTAFLLAISPWHIQFSRVAFETNVGLTFNILTALFFLKGLKKPRLLSLSAVCAALAIYVYQSEKVFTPLFVLLLVVIYRKKLYAVPLKYLAAAVLTGIVVMMPMATYIVTNSKSLTRAQATLVFSDDAYLKSDVARLVADTQRHDIVAKAIDNRRVLYLISVAAGWLAHYDFKWLFLAGDLNRHHAPGMGLMYLVEFPFFLLGIYLLLFSEFIPKQYRKGVWLIFGWFLLAPVPASFTSGVPHAVRTLNFLPTPQFFTAVGLIGFYAFMKRREFFRQKVGKITVAGLSVIAISILFSLNFLYFLDQYFVQQNYFYAYDWQYGHKQAVEFVQSVEDKYDKIIVSKEEPLDQAQMFYLFYLDYPPATYQVEAKDASGGFRENHAFSKFEFRPIKFAEENKDGKTLFVGRPSDFPGASKILKKIYYPNGIPAIYIVQQ